MTINLSVAILAGGQSSRMGQNKALLTLHGKSLIQHVLTTAEALNPAEILIVTNTPDSYAHLDYRMIADIHVGHGAISGIMSALSHSKTDHVLVIACDMPFVKTELLHLLINQAKSDIYQVIVPTVAGYPQGVLAIYHKSSLARINQAIEAGQYKLKEVLESLESVVYVDESLWQAIDPHRLSFTNLNTPADFDSANKQST